MITMVLIMHFDAMDKAQEEGNMKQKKNKAKRNCDKITNLLLVCHLMYYVPEELMFSLSSVI